MMGRSWFLGFLLVLALLLLSSSSQGFGWKMIGAVEFGDSEVSAEETGGRSREMMAAQVLDYQLDPEPNTNPKSGYISVPPPKG